MTLRERLERLTDGLPEEASVSLPVSAVERWLEEEAEEAEARGQKLWTVSELAERYDRSESTVRTWLGRNEFPGAFKVHGSWRVPTDALRQFESDGDDGPTLGSERD